MTPTPTTPTAEQLAVELAAGIDDDGFSPSSTAAADGTMIVGTFTPTGPGVSGAVPVEWWARVHVGSPPR